MSRHIKRQIQASTARKAQALRKFALKEYGDAISLADLHPDVQYGLGLLFAVHKAFLGNDSATAMRLLELTGVYIAKYAGQEHVISPTEKDLTALAPSANVQSEQISNAVGAG